MRGQDASYFDPVGRLPNMTKTPLPTTAPRMQSEGQGDELVFLCERGRSERGSRFEIHPKRDVVVAVRGAIRRVEFLFPVDRDKSRHGLDPLEVDTCNREELPSIDKPRWSNKPTMQFEEEERIVCLVAPMHCLCLERRSFFQLSIETLLSWLRLRALDKGQKKSSEMTKQKLA